MKNIDYYNLDNEYPVNYHFWKDLSAIFIYWGFYKPIIWKGGFKNETIKRIKNAFIDANQKIKSGVSFTEYELAKDKISHNYSSFRYYFERAGHYPVKCVSRKVRLGFYNLSLFSKISINWFKTNPQL